MNKTTLAGTLSLSYLPLQSIIGSLGGFFSLGHCFTPLVGFFSSTSTSMGWLIVRFCISSILGYTMGLAQIGGTLYLTLRHRLIKALLPALCMLVFMAHPVGHTAWYYSLYWLIPVTISLLKPRSIFLQSLACTFFMHALGSTIWLYTHSTHALFWYSLMPLVPLERMLFASIMTAGYYGITWITLQITALRSLCPSH